MKTLPIHFLAFLAVVISAGFPEKSGAQAPALSRMTPEEVAEFVVGKEYKNKDGRRLQFVTSRVVRFIYSGETKVWGFRVDENKTLRFKSNASLESTGHEMIFREDLKTARYKRSGKGNPEMTYVGPWRPEGLGTGTLKAGTAEQFDRWLQTKQFVKNEDGGRFTFDRGIVRGMTSPYATRMTVKYRVIEPGLIEAVFAGRRFQQYYLTVSPDLETFEYWKLGHHIKGAIEDRGNSEINPAAAALYAQTESMTSLARVSDEGFQQWLMGTTWEGVDEVDALAFRFVSPQGFLFWNFNEQTHSGRYTITAKGEIHVPWAGEEGRKDRIVISNDLKSAVWHTHSGGKWEMRLIDRSIPEEVGRGELGKMNVEEFKLWLMSKSFNVQGVPSVNALQFFGNGEVRGFANPDFQYTIVTPGLVELYSGANGCRLLSFSSDLQYASLTSPWWEKSVQINEAKGGEFTWTSSRGKESTGDVDTEGLKEIDIEKNLASVNALLLLPLGNSSYAAQTSKLSLTALGLEGSEPADISFNQPVGEMMNSALSEVVRFHALRHGGWPRGLDIELAFAEKYSGKDGPSAAVACALLLESMITGATLRPDVAVTGDLNADGSVQPVGGVRAKLRGAFKGGANIVMVPNQNREDVLDMLILLGPTFLTKLEVYGLDEFDEAIAIATEDKDGGLDYSIARETFQQFIDEYGVAGIRDQGARELLSQVAELVPNHLSARLLLSYSSGNVPSQLSLSGSLVVVDQAVGNIVDAAKSDLAATNRLDAGEVGQVAAELQRLRSVIDDRAKGFCDAWIEWARAVDQFLSGRLPPSKARDDLRAISRRIKAEREALLSDSSVQEDLLR